MQKNHQANGLRQTRQEKEQNKVRSLGKGREREKQRSEAAANETSEGSPAAWDHTRRSKHQPVSKSHGHLCHARSARSNGQSLLKGANSTRCLDAHRDPLLAASQWTLSNATETSLSTKPHLPLHYMRISRSKDRPAFHQVWAAFLPPVMLLVQTVSSWTSSASLCHFCWVAGTDKLAGVSFHAHLCVHFSFAPDAT